MKTKEQQIRAHIVTEIKDYVKQRKMKDNNKKPLQFSKVKNSNTKL